MMVFKKYHNNLLKSHNLHTLFFFIRIINKHSLMPKVFTMQGFTMQVFIKYIYLNYLMKLSVNFVNFVIVTYLKTLILFLIIFLFLT